MMKDWKVTGQVRTEDKGELSLVIFVSAENRREAKKAGLRSFIRMPGVISVGPVEAVDARFGDWMSTDQEVS